MFYCKSCGYEFECADLIYESHGLYAPPFEQVYVCPACKSTDFLKKSLTHCRCCGARLPKGSKEYCCNACRIRGERLRQMERRRRKIADEHPINLIIRKADAYNLKHGTKYSYGQYVALIKPKEDKAEKKVKRSETAKKGIS